MKHGDVSGQAGGVEEWCRREMGGEGSEVGGEEGAGGGGAVEEEEGWWEV